MKKISIGVGILVVLSILVGSGYYYIQSYPKKIITSSVFPHVDIPELSQTATGIIKGKVVQILPSQKGVRKRDTVPTVYTDVVIKVSETIKGQPQDQVIVRTVGGNAGEGLNRLVVIGDDPSFSVGQEVVIFLSKEGDGFFDLPEGYYTSGVGEQGTYYLADGKASNFKGTLSEEELMQQIKTVLKQ